MIVDILAFGRLRCAIRRQIWHKEWLPVKFGSAKLFDWHPRGRA